jgi:uncharacterized spore protein YtfJ
VVVLIAAGLLPLSFAAGQKPAEKKSQAPAVQPANELAGAMAQRLGKDLNVKTVVGAPVKAGSVTLIPILMLDVNFGGAGMASAGADGYYMSGEARPLGFVAITRKGTRFISVAKAPSK